MTQQEQTRARYPDSEGYIERDGVKVFYEVYGDGDPTILFCPTWTLIHSRVWKLQIAYLARHFRVIVFDPRGNGRSDRPRTREAYAEKEFAQDALDVLDATGTEQAFVVGLSRGTQRSLLLAAEHPDRVLGLIFIGPFFAISRTVASFKWRLMSNPRLAPLFFRKPISTRGFLAFNAVHVRTNYRAFVEWFAATATAEAHSTKAFDDVVGWALEGDPESLVLSSVADNAVPMTRRDQTALAEKVQCPVLVISGTKDKITPHADAKELVRVTGGQLVTIDGGDHEPHGRHPVLVNHAIREFMDPTFRPGTTGKRSSGRPRALFISSPIGLGHARRDVAIAQELRRLVPDLQVDWLAQDPVTRVLATEGERLHPASAFLASESGHIEAESAEHDLHAFQAIRRMDEILMANFMVFDDVVREERYDLWIGDEAWELDYHLHENPSLKRAPFAWLTDFVGFLPMPEGGEREAYLTTDYNAEMVEHIANQPQIRDRSIFVGNPDDVVPGGLGAGLPGIREWTEQHFDFSGYITGFDQSDLKDRERLRHDLGYRPDERVCLVTVGGSGVGGHLLRKVMEAFPAAKKLVPELRMVVVAGPRVDLSALPDTPGLEVHAYVADLYRHLAACDLAVVQGGLTTSMELTAVGRPFLYFPLRHHFEQNFHVSHRLDRYGAGCRMDYDESTPESIAEAIAEQIGRDVTYRPVETDGARRAAERIAELLN
ncbi:alpha/beta fold hydrolase [Nocardioides humilatus]|uniref:Alpha/beta fold hydrolase n=1 Tax=Nocardioides humilatus TaxID=2607660 RepID=A0A5B1LIA0_9ACTN|nr:alpha/beta hydrolase [Nocardioides humilatus]KAA1419339.1 alpha/beta fold hydrolase [Nocardioides humilatus]